MFAISVAKVVFAVWGEKRWSHREFCDSGCFREKRECLQKMLPRGEVVARYRSEIRHRRRHRQFCSWRKVVPVCGVLNSSNSYSTGNPWSKTQGIHKLDGFPHCFHVAAAAAIEEQADETSALNEVVQPKRVFDGFPQLLLPRKVFGMNRISHPDWVKLCAELNYAPNKNTKIPSATYI